MPTAGPTTRLPTTSSSTSLLPLLSPKPYHLLLYSTLLGSTFFQSFLAGPIAFTALPRPQFSTLQTAIFPPYFVLQTVIPILLAATWPGAKVVAGGSLLGSAGGGAGAGPRGWLEGGREVLWRATVPLAVMFATGLANLVLLGPWTTRVMKERKHQETRDGKKYYDPGPKSQEMERVNTRFAWLHGASSLANLVGLGAMVGYGFVLGERL